MQLQSGKSMLIEAAVLIYKLDDDRLYAPWQVAASGFDRKTNRAEYDRIRLNLGEWSRYHNIRETFENRDDKGDRKGRYPAWYGKSWKEHLGHKDLEAAKKWIESHGKAARPAIKKKSDAKAEQTKPSGTVPEVLTVKPRLAAKRWLFAAVLPIAATLLFYFANSGERIQGAPAAAEIAQTQPAPTDADDTSLSVSDFALARKALAQKKSSRVPQYNHPHLGDLTWDMTLVDEPLFQAAVLPNCVFLVSKVPRGMMPSDFDR